MILLILVLIDTKWSQKAQKLNNNAFVVDSIIGCVNLILSILCKNPMFLSVDRKLVKEKVIKKFSK